MKLALPSALASATTARPLARSVSPRSARMTSTVAPGTPLSRTIAPLARPTEPGLSVALHAGGTPPLPEPLARAVAVELAPAAATTRLANREVRRLALRHLPVRAGQSCTNQATVNGAVILPMISGGNGQNVGAPGVHRGIERFCNGDIGIGEIIDRLRSFRERFGTERAFHRFTG